MPLVTNHMLRKKLSEVQLESRAGISSLGNNTTNTESLGPVSVTEKRINRVQGDELIAVDGTKAKLFYPIPGVKWECRGQTGGQGIKTLENEISGLFISDGTTSYCLGVWGDTSEFEVVLEVGDNELRLNDLFLSLQAGMCVKNGLEANL